MMQISMSRPASRLLRQLIDRAGEERNRILLTQIKSTPWHSLTFSGERHLIDLRVTGARAEALAMRLTDGLADAEFAIPGHIVADVAVVKRSAPDVNGAVSVELEALTIEE